MNHRILLTAVLALSMTTVAVPTALASGTVVQETSGDLLLGKYAMTFGVEGPVGDAGYDGISRTEFPLDSAAIDGDFTLEATDGIGVTGGQPNFDLCFVKKLDIGGTQVIECHAGPTDESGTVPAGATHVQVDLTDGVDSSFLFQVVGA